MEIDSASASGFDSPSSSAASSDPTANEKVSGDAVAEVPEEGADNEEEEEEDVCRICRNPGESDNPIPYPCACSGSINFIHQDFLLQWLNHSNTRQCGLGELQVAKRPKPIETLLGKQMPKMQLVFKDLLVLAKRLEEMQKMLLLGGRCRQHDLRLMLNRCLMV